ncbi:MAG: alpha/beta hydrolase-fold protein [Eubacteriales bacterium]|nr:alpha/beta hydrolase-fold protein [Eubacteriales bacterium]
MALVRMNFESECLGNNHEITVILPDKPRSKTPAQFYGAEKKYKVLWLLHGTFGDSSDWLRKSNIELYACEKDLIVVMPSGLNANYGNWPEFGMGFRMYDYLFDELMPLIYGWFPASDKREDNFIAGLSMGGRGVCVYAFNHPEKFAGAAVLSAAPRYIPDQETFEPTMWERTKRDIERAGGMEAFLASYENTWRLADEKAGTGELPRLYFACGGDDMLYAPFARFENHAKEIGLEATFETIPGYKHEWRFWDLAIQKALTFFGLDGEEDAGNPF